MIQYEATAKIQAPVETAWLLLSDVLHWHRWTSTVTRVEALDKPELAPGHRFRVHQPGLRPTVWSVTAVEAPTSFTWEARLPGVTMLAGHTLERAADHTGLRLTFAFRGVLGGLVGRWYRSLVEAYLATEAAALRRHAEASVSTVASRDA